MKTAKLAPSPWLVSGEFTSVCFLNSKELFALKNDNFDILCFTYIYDCEPHMIISYASKHTSLKHIELNKLAHLDYVGTVKRVGTDCYRLTNYYN